jgi:hypothetical protein
MTKQLFAQLDDLAAEQVVGGFKTAKVEVTYNLGDNPDTEEVETDFARSVATVSWNGLWNEGKKGKGNVTDGVSNNVYSDSFDGTNGITYFDEFGQEWFGGGTAGAFTQVGD